MNNSTGDIIKVDTARLPLLLRELRLADDRRHVAGLHRAGRS